MTTPPFQRPSEVPPEITFITLPTAIAQFHHLPIHVPIWIHKEAEAQEKGYNFQDGAGAMEELLKQAPNVPGAYLFHLFIQKWPKLMALNPYFAAGRIAEVIPKLVEVLQVDPECPLTAFQLGYCFRATGELEKSESFYKQALRMAPDAGWIYSNLGRTYQAMADKPRAVEAFWKALELMPGDQFVLEQLVELGELFVIPREGKEGPEAAFVRKADYEKKMREALEKDEDAGNCVRLGWKLLQDKLNDLARQAFEKALRKDKGLSEASLGLGITHLESGRYKDAERILSEYLESHPDSVTAHLNLFKTYLAQKEEDLAWDEIQTAVRLDPDRLDVLRQLYFLFLESGRKEEALEWLDRLATENEKSHGPLMVKAWAMEEDGRWPEAEENLREALARAPHNEEVLLYYTAGLGKRGKRADIIQLLLAEPEPLSLSLTINLAMAYSQLGQLKKGRALLEKFLKREEISLVDQQRVKALISEMEKEE